MKLTKLEQFVADHPDIKFESIATMLNRSVVEIERAYLRYVRKADARKLELARAKEASAQRPRV